MQRPWACALTGSPTTDIVGATAPQFRRDLRHLLRTEMKNVLFGALCAACLFTLSWALVGVMLAINFTLSLTVSLASFVVGVWASGQVKE